MSGGEANEKQVFRSMANHVNHYIQFKESKSFSEIEKLLKDFFDASDIKIWYCDRDTKELREFAKKDSSPLAMDMSLTKKVIESKKPLIENHITSNKYFNLSIDNPLNLKVKSLLMFPIVRHKKVIGIVRIWRGMKQRNNFSKKDEESLAFLEPLFLGLIESITIEKALILSIIGRDFIDKDSISVESNKASIKKPVVKKEILSKNKLNSSKVKHKESPLEVLEKKYIELKADKLKQEKLLKKELENSKLKILESKKDFKNIDITHQEDVNQLEQKIKDYKLEIERIKEDLESTNSKSRTSINHFEKQLKASELEINEKEQKFQEITKVQTKEIKDLTKELTSANTQISNNNYILENIQKELLSAIHRYQTSEATAFKLKNSVSKDKQRIEELEKELEVSKNENKVLHERIKAFKEVETPISIRDLKSQQIQHTTTESIFSKDKVEDLLQHFDTDFKENQCSYICFELIVYALSSKKGMMDIEEVLVKSKVLSEIIDMYYFKGDLITNNERNTIIDLVKHIESYEEDIFANKMKVHINVNEEMPTSLVFDRIKIQSILLHLLNDLYQCVNRNSDITLDIGIKNKYLHIELGTFMHEKSTLLNNIFKQTNLALDNKDRVGLQLSRKIIERLKGKIDSSYEDTYYKLIVTVPVQVIKL